MTSPIRQMPGGKAWWATVFAHATASLGKMTTSLFGIHADIGTIAASLPKTLASLAGIEHPMGSIAAAEPKLTAALAGGQTQAGTIVDVLPAAPSTALVAAQIQQGAMASSLPGMSTAAVGGQAQVGTIATLEQPPATALAGIEHPMGTIAAAEPQLATALIGAEQPQGTIASALQQTAAALNGQEIEQGSIATTLQKTATALAGAQTQSGTIAAALQKALTALTGQQTGAIPVLDNSGVSAVQTAGIASGTAFTPLQLTVTAGAYVIVTVNDGVFFNNIQGESFGTTATVTVGSVTLTSLGCVNNANGDNGYQWVFGAFHAAGGTNLNITVTLTESGRTFTGYVAAYSYNGVVSVSKLAMSYGSVLPPALPTQAFGGALVWGQLSWRGSSTPAGFTLTQRQSQSGNNTSGFSGGDATATGQVVTNTITGSDSWSAVALLLCGTSVSLPPMTKGVETSQTTSVTIPPHKIGQLITIYAMNTGSTTVPAKPTASGNVPNFVAINNSAGANTCASATFQFTATANNHTSGTWANTNAMIAVVTDGQNATPIGGHAESGSTATGAAGVVAPAVTMTKTDGSSLLLEFFGYRSTTLTWSAAPTGYAQENSNGSVCLDIKKDTTSDGSVTQQNNSGSSTGYRAATVEILAA